MTKPSLVLTKTPHEGICIITLNRPEKRNALDGIFIQEWITVLQQIERDPSVRVVLMNANGEHFCAGADLAWMQKMAHCSQAENIDDAMQLANLLKIIHQFSKPVIGLIHGATMGGGLGVIASCDMVIATTDSVFCFSETKMGLAPSVISPYVVSVIGERLARYYFLTAEKFNVQTATELTLVQQVVSKTELLEAGLILSKKLLNNSPHALAEVKKIIPLVARNSISEKTIQMTAEHLASMRASKDAQEGLKAFLEKRSPVWESSCHYQIK